MEKKTIAALTIACFCAAEIYRIFLMKILYSKEVDETELKNMLENFSETLKKSLKDDIWKEYLGLYEEPVYENDTAPSILIQMIAAAGGFLEKNKIDYLEKLRECLPPEISELNRRLNEIQIFECKFPNPDAATDYKNPKRFLYLLQEYWERYLNILQFTANAPILTMPHPLGRFVINLGYRIETCIQRVNSELLIEAYEKLTSLDPVASEDFGIDWECGGLQIAQEFEKALQKAVVELGSRKFELTEAESHFLTTCDNALKYVSKKNKEHWEISLERVSSEFQKKETENKNLPKSTSEYIQEVESRLRELIKVVYKNSFSEEWLNKIKENMEKESWDSAKKSMKSRGAENEDDFIYFTQLKDLQPIISKKWDLFKDCFTIHKKEFNSLLSGIIKGRTEEFHTRPEHLWPPIEKDRIRVHCHDLLKALK